MNSWTEAFAKVKTFWEASLDVVAQWETEEGAQRFRPTAKPHQEYATPVQGVIPIPSAPLFWSTLVQDTSGRQISLEEVVSRRTTVFVFLYSYGSLVARQAIMQILASAKEEFLDHGLHVVVLGGGANGLAQKVFAKELGSKDKAPNGVHYYCDHRCSITQTFRKHFEMTFFNPTGKFKQYALIFLFDAPHNFIFLSFTL